MSKNWHATDIADIEKTLNTDVSDGISSREARSRLQKEVKQRGAVESLFVPSKRKPILSFLTFLNMPFVLLLLVMSILTAAFGRVILGASVFTVTLATTFLGGFLSFTAQRNLESLSEYASPMVKVKRGGSIFYTDGRNAVSGDVIMLVAGDILPCDARIVVSENLVVDELYDNNGAISKRRLNKNYATVTDDCEYQNSPNMLFAGSAVISGNAVAIVVSTGNEVYLSKIVPSGGLGGKITEPSVNKRLVPTLYKLSFLVASAVLILSLVALLTLRDKLSYVAVFTMLLSAIFLISTELLTVGSKAIVSTYMKRLSKVRSSYKDRDNSAVIRGTKTLETLSGVTDILLIGTAGLFKGMHSVTSIATAAEITEGELDEADRNHLVELIYTYVSARRSGDFIKKTESDGIAEMLYSFIKDNKLDNFGAPLAFRSLYFVNDAKTGYGYACAETDTSIYRTALISDSKIINSCNLIRDGGRVREITDEDARRIRAFMSQIEAGTSKVLICVSENDAGQAFEGIVALEKECDTELNEIMSDIKQCNLNLTAFLPNDNEESNKIVTSECFSKLFSGKIAYASEFEKNNIDVLGTNLDYCAYIGFSSDQYCAIVSEMKKRGRITAAYGVDNDYNEIMARADVAVSCDVIKYSSAKYRESVYERMPVEGIDIGNKASQQTRLLSKVIVKRAHKEGGGVRSLFKAVRMSRGAYITLGQSILMFIFLMSGLLTFAAMSVITGTVFLDPLMTVTLSATFAFLSITVFNSAEHSRVVVAKRRDYVNYPLDVIKKNKLGVILRVSAAAITAIAIKILDVIGIFGEKATYTLPIFICLALTMFAEFFAINVKYTRKGEGRSYCWLKVLIAYAVIMSVCALSAFGLFSAEFHPNGIGAKEYLIVPGFIVLYCVAIGIQHTLALKNGDS